MVFPLRRCLVIFRYPVKKRKFHRLSWVLLQASEIKNGGILSLAAGIGSASNERIAGAIYGNYALILFFTNKSELIKQVLRETTLKSIYL